MHRFISYNSRKTIKKYLFLLLDLLIIAFIVATLIFFIMNSVPGRKEEILSSYPSNPELGEKIVAELGLDQPIFTRYTNYIGKLIFHGDLGTSSSLFPSQKISSFMFKKFSISFQVGIVAVILALVIGIPIGIYVGKRPGGISDTVATILFSVGFAIPSFVFGLFIMIGFYKMDLPFIYDINNKFTIFLPAISLAIPSIASYIRYLRTSVNQEQLSQYAKFARAKGCIETRVVWKRTLKKSLYPIATYLPLAFLASFIGSIIIEAVFGVPGSGRFLIEAVQSGDVDVVRALIVVLTTIVIVGFF